MTTETDPEYPFFRLSNKMPVLLKPIPGVQSVAVAVWINTGGRHESLDQCGISHFIEHLVFKGTQSYGCEAIKRQIEGIGGSINAFTSEEHTCYMAKVPSEFVSRALKVLSELVFRPRLDANDIERERAVILEEIAMLEDSSSQFSQELLHQSLWPNHALGRLLSGTPDSVRRLDAQKLLRYWKRHYHPQNMLITVAGHFDEGKLKRQIQEYFGGGRSRRITGYAMAPRRLSRASAQVVEKKNEQTHICLGTYAGSRQHPGRYAMELFNIIVGGNMSSRLFREVREKRGLVYDIGSHVRRYEDTGLFCISAACEATKLARVLTTISSQLRRVRDQGVSAAELGRAKDYYCGQFLMGLEESMEHALWMGETLLSSGHLPDPQALIRRIRRVEMPEMDRYVGGFLKRAKFHLAVVGPVNVDQGKQWLQQAQLNG